MGTTKGRMHANKKWSYYKAPIEPRREDKDAKLILHVGRNVRDAVFDRAIARGISPSELVEGLLWDWFRDNFPDEQGDIDECERP